MTGEASEDLTGVTAICVNETLGCLPALLFGAKSAFWWASLTACLLSAGSRGPSARPSLSFRVPRRTLPAAELSWGLQGTHWTVRPAASVNLSSVCFMPRTHKEAFFLSHFVLFLIPFIYIWFFLAHDENISLSPCRADTVPHICFHSFHANLPHWFQKEHMNQPQKADLKIDFENKPFLSQGPLRSVHEHTRTLTYMASRSMGSLHSI